MDRKNGGSEGIDYIEKLHSIVPETNVTDVLNGYK